MEEPQFDVEVSAFPNIIQNSQGGSTALNALGGIKLHCDH